MLPGYEGRYESGRAGAAGSGADPGLPGHHRGPASRQARCHRAGRPPVRQHSARGGHPGRVHPGTLRRLPAWPRTAAATPGVQRHRGPRPGHGRAGRPSRRRRSRQPGRRRARQDRPCTPGTGGRAGRGSSPGNQAGARSRGRAAGPPDRHDPRPGQHRPPSAAHRLSLRGRLGMDQRGRPVGGRRPPRPVVPAVLVAPRGRDPRVPRRPGPRGGAARQQFQLTRRFRPGDHAGGPSRRRLGVRSRDHHRRAGQHRGTMRASCPGQGGGDWRQDGPDDRNHQQPGLVCRAAGEGPRPLPDRALPRTPGRRPCPGTATAGGGHGLRASRLTAGAGRTTPSRKRSGRPNSR